MDSPPKTQRFDCAEQEVFLNLWRTYDCLKLLEDQLFAPYDLSAQQYNALRLLQAVSPGAMATLALGRRLISRAPDVTRLLDRLERRALIARNRRNDNRRVVEVNITVAGLELLAELAEPVRRMHSEQLGHLTSAERQCLVDLLKRAREPHEDSSCDWISE